MRGSPTISLLMCAILGFPLLACGDGYLDAAFSPEPDEYIFEDSETETDSETGLNPDTGLDTGIDTEPVSIYMEAEIFHSWDSNGIDRAWFRVDGENIPEGEDDHTATAVGNAYMQALQDTTLVDTDSTTDAAPISSNNIANPSVSCHVGYYVTIPRPGRYYIWVRGWAGDNADNTAHVGFDHTWPDSGRKIQFPNLQVDDWVWSSHQRDAEGQVYGVPNTIYLDIETAGRHEIIFAMREDGFAFDRWVMTTETDYTPIDD